jgi:hypothetical protein
MFKVFCLVLFFSSFTLVSQTYYLTGRPFSFERNNAIKEVAFRWNFTMSYAGNDVVDAVGLDSLNRYNDSIHKLIGEQSSFGNDWLNELFEQTDKEELIHEKIRNQLRIHPLFILKTKDHEDKFIGYVEHFILVTKASKPKHYKAFVWSKNAEGVICLASFDCKFKRKVTIKYLNDCQLPYEIPQNGLILKEISL